MSFDGNRGIILDISVFDVRDYPGQCLYIHILRQNRKSSITCHRFSHSFSADSIHIGSYDRYMGCKRNYGIYIHLQPWFSIKIILEQEDIFIGELFIFIECIIKFHRKIISKIKNMLNDNTILPPFYNNIFHQKTIWHIMGKKLWWVNKENDLNKNKKSQIQILEFFYNI